MTPNQPKSSPMQIEGITQLPNFLRVDKNFSVKEGFTVQDYEIVLKNGQKFSRYGVRGANYTLSISDYLVGITALAVTTTIGLPNPSRVGAGKTYIIKDEAGGATTTNITIRSEGERNIDGSSSTTLSTNYQSKQFYTDGSNWFTC